MRTPEAAISDILRHVRPIRETSSLPLADAAGRVLAQDAVSDVDMPPFEKSAMDGYALRCADVGSGEAAERAPLRRIGESRAGHPFNEPVPSGTCVEIYTGAEVPAGCDAVIMVEKIEREGDLVRLTEPVREGQNICNQGEDLRVGGVVMRPGRRLTPTDLSVLAAVGCDPLTVFRRPRVTILTTGDELVRPAERPGPGQIREGNTLHLAALSARAGAQVTCLGLVPDEPGELARRFGLALENSDVVVTTGGVSMGRYDLVAEAFRTCGVEEIFHKIAIKPGKPLWFGRRGEVLVFGLPGNPVSCLLDHEVFVRPALTRMEGANDEQPALRLG
ncbi:MAG: gephyrin-like molybdotransferase Glp, partial [Planctomycetota bacterium]